MFVFTVSTCTQCIQCFVCNCCARLIIIIFIRFVLHFQAKLPRGIENIRPHIKQIDNVPLLVSLFTDCTPSVIREMLQIMQEFGEVVCVMCSSANADNMGICLQADASIAIEPLYPQVCQRESVYKTCGSSPSPIDLSRALNSISCPLSFRREDPFPIYQLIMTARHFMLSIWNMMQFWLCCCMTLTLIQFLCIILMLPPIFRTSQVLWLCLLVIPVLSISLMGQKTNETVMKKPQGKNHSNIKMEVLIYILWSYGAKFLPMIVIVVLVYSATLATFCLEICTGSNCSCFFVFSPEPLKNSTAEWAGWREHDYSLYLAQHLALLTTVLHYCKYFKKYIM